MMATQEEYAELAYGNDPVRVASYMQSAMRDHLLLCLEQGKMELFPHSRKPAATCIRKIVSFALYCVCKLPETGHMVCCDQCNDWYHALPLCGDHAKETCLNSGSASYARVPRTKEEDINS